MKNKKELNGHYNNVKFLSLKWMNEINKDKINEAIYSLVVQI